MGSCKIHMRCSYERKVCHADRIVHQYDVELLSHMTCPFLRMSMCIMKHTSFMSCSRILLTVNAVILFCIRTMAAWQVKGTAGAMGAGPVEAQRKAKIVEVDPRQVAPRLDLSLKLGLATAPKTRLLESAGVWSFLFPRTSTLADSMKAIGKNYSNTMRKEGRGHKIGPPHPQDWVALVNALLGFQQPLLPLELSSGHQQSFNSLQTHKTM